MAIFCRKLAAMSALTTDRDGPLQMLAEEVSLRRNQCAEELLRGFHQTSEPVRGALKAIVSSMDPVGPGHTALQAAVGLGKSGTASHDPGTLAAPEGDATTFDAFDAIDTNQDGMYVTTL